jgi:predicted Zn-dependent protease
MIATTQRGLLVTRFWGVHGDSGLTRDGLWLIENGKISKAVKNFRYVESPIVALNQVDQLGVPVPVFRPVRKPDVKREGLNLSGPPVFLTPAVVPPLKIRDFSFTAMADAV